MGHHWISTDDQVGCHQVITNDKWVITGSWLMTKWVVTWSSLTTFWQHNLSHDLSLLSSILSNVFRLSHAVVWISRSHHFAEILLPKYPKFLQLAYLADLTAWSFCRSWVWFLGLTACFRALESLAYVSYQKKDNSRWQDGIAHMELQWCKELLRSKWQIRHRLHTCKDDRKMNLLRLRIGFVPWKWNKMTMIKRKLIKANFQHC
jgi:hypothetical protein